MSENTHHLICEGCGETFDADDVFYDHAVHARSCQGDCKNCPQQCGPVVTHFAFYDAEIATLLALVEQLATALTNAHPLAVCWAGKYQFDNGLDEFHETHEKICTEIRNALAAAAPRRRKA